MKHLLIGVCMLCCFNGFSQTVSTDKIKYEKKLSGKRGVKVNVKTKRSGLGNALLTFYQKNLSVLISADCIYNPSCSRYSRDCINTYGLFRGVLATTDRLTRCNPLSWLDIPSYKINNSGKASDGVRELSKAQPR